MKLSLNTLGSFRSVYAALGDKGTLYSWITMCSQLLFMVAIIPMASVQLSPADLAFWLSALLLMALSSPADFGVYNTIIRSLPFVISGRNFPEFLSSVKTRRDASSLNSDDIQTRIFSLFAFGLKQLLFPVMVVLLIGAFAGYYIYQGRTGVSGNHTFLLTILFYWLVIPIQTFARFFESMLVGGGHIAVAKQNEAITVVLRVIVLATMLINAAPIFYLGIIHMVATLAQLFLNIRSSTKTLLSTFDWRSVKRYLRLFSLKEQSNFTRGQYRFGVNLFSSYIIMNIGPLTVTGMKSDESVSFYLIMVRMFQAVKQVAQVPLVVAVPRLVELRANEKVVELLDLFTKRSLITVMLYMCGLCLSFLYAQYFFGNTGIDYFYYLCLFGLVIFLELNHSNHAQLVLSRNVQPFLVPSFLAAFLSAILMYPMFLKFGIVGVILVQGLVQLVCSNWYSVYLNMKEFDDRLLAVYRFDKKK